MMPVLASHQLTPVTSRCCSKRRKARMAQPMWARCASRRPHLRPLHAALLLEAAMILLDAPGPLGVLQPRQVVHRLVAGRPVLRVSVWGDEPEHADEAVALQVDARARRRDGALAQRPVAGPVRVDQPVALELRQPAPAVAAHRLEVLQAGVPAVEGDALGREAARLRPRRAWPGSGRSWSARRWPCRRRR